MIESSLLSSYKFLGPVRKMYMLQGKNYLLSSSMFLGAGGGVMKLRVSSSDVVFSTSNTHTVVRRTKNSVAGCRCSESTVRGILC